MALLRLMKPIIDRRDGLTVVGWREERPHVLMGLFKTRFPIFCRIWVSYEADTYWLNYYDSSVYFTAVVRPWLVLAWLLVCAAAMIAAVAGRVPLSPVWLVIALLFVLEVLFAAGRIWSTPADHRAVVPEALAVRRRWDRLSAMHTGEGRDHHPQGMAPVERKPGEPLLIIARFGNVDALVLSLSLASEDERDRLQLELEAELIGARDVVIAEHRRAQAAAV